MIILLIMILVMETPTTNASQSAVLDDIVFTYSETEDAKKNYASQCSDMALVVFDKFNTTQEVFCGPFSDKQKIRDFLSSINNSTKITRLQWGPDQGLNQTDMDALVLVRREDDEGVLAEDIFRKAVKPLRGKFLLRVYVVLNTYRVSETGPFQVNVVDLPLIRIVQPSQRLRRFAFTQQISSKNIQKFADDFKAGKLSPYFYSQPLPINPVKNGVHTVVGDTFEDIVLNEDDDVLLIGHTDGRMDYEFIKVLEQLKNQLGDVKHLTISHMNIELNEYDGTLPSTSRQGFMRLYLRGQKNAPIEYNTDYLAGRDIAKNILNFFTLKCSH